ncbi:hypothetical protein L6452_04137 [Arctium lappa]|uniref:Uncharacterized protein n=1 Tax=Arctium lappa TaxID=4217 RepID=A0ACB9FPM4_ARCLA|nr:hypothetical protein L6452_04137 [Arctium lappa]
MNHHKQQQTPPTATTIDLSALLMSSESNRRAAFPPPNMIRNPNLEGTNMGATMIIHCGSNDSGGGVNIYVNNNIQGLNNSIMIGSRLHMGDPGVWFTFKDSKLESWFSKKSSSHGGCLSLGFYALSICVVVVAFVLIFFV